MEPTIGGVDEAGRGPVLGPMVVAGVKVTQTELEKLDTLNLRDSKMCTPKRRDRLALELKKICKIQLEILPATKIVPKLLHQKRRTVGIRIPDSPLCHEIVNILGEPILSTSVPDGSDGFFTDPHEIINNMENDVDMVLDAGILKSEHSTIVDLSQDTPEIFREGAGDISLIY